MNDTYTPPAPAFQAGVEYLPMSREDEITATFDQRWQAVWPFVLKKVRVFVGNLTRHERAGIGVEDCVQEIWIELRKKDRHWDHTRGKYITFVGTLMWRRLADMRAAAKAGEFEPDGYEDHVAENETEDDAGEAVDARQAVEALLIGLSQLSPYEALVLGKHYGLWGTRAMSYVEIGKLLGMSASRCRAVADGGKSKLLEEVRSRGITR